MGDTQLTGSCLCGAVRYSAIGEPKRFYHCHCQRCRKASGAAHASNLFLQGTLAWDSGEEMVTHFKHPDAERFTNSFCRHCGARMPRFIEKVSMVMIPAGSLNDEPGIEVQARIFVGSRAGWSCTHGTMTEFEEYPG